MVSLTECSDNMISSSLTSCFHKCQHLPRNVFFPGIMVTSFSAISAHFKFLFLITIKAKMKTLP